MTITIKEVGVLRRGIINYIEAIWTENDRSLAIRLTFRKGIVSSKKIIESAMTEKERVSFWKQSKLTVERAAQAWVKQHNRDLDNLLRQKNIRIIITA